MVRWTDADYERANGVWHQVATANASFTISRTRTETDAMTYCIAVNESFWMTVLHKTDSQEEEGEGFEVHSFSHIGIAITDFLIHPH